MFPLHQAYEAKEAVKEYLTATFEFSDINVSDSFMNFIEDKNHGLFKGPYVSLKLPFVKADANEELPLDIKPNFTPYLHQLKSFKRLTTYDGNNPKATLLTTGTGSGKTECFMYPILDYCFKNKERHGIKAIIMYPMNALATDQAKRLAEIIWNDERLKGKITVGLFIGTHGKFDKNNKKKNKQYPSIMCENHVIENKDIILDSPPDILLTNFKMLDYSLMRSEYHRLWNRNFKEEDLLKFLVLDELHTYDGAKGTDVANLIRRLKLKLNIKDGIICPVGTSATIGNKEESKGLLSEFASKVFGEPIDQTSVIEEERLTTEQFFSNIELNDFLPSADEIKEAIFTEEDDSESYKFKQLKLWQINENISPLMLSEKLKEFQFLKNILDCTSKNILHIEDLIINLTMLNKDFSKLSSARKQSEINLQNELLKSFFFLICNSKIGSESRMFPFLYFQVQQWFKELSGILRVVDEEPQFSWSYEKSEKSTVSLPAYYCRECGNSGWLGFKTEPQDKFERDRRKIYQKYFQNNPNIYLISRKETVKADDYEPNEVIDGFISTKDLSIEYKEKEDFFGFRAFKKTNTKGFLENVCPHCNSRNTIAIIGQQVVTLASVAVSEVLASPIDRTDERNRKLLVFTNSVQDAAHQAGFFQARNYRFLLRTAINQIIKTKGEIKLNELYKEFAEYWTHTIPDSKDESIEAYLYKFFPPDYIGRLKLETFKKNGKYDENFIKEFHNRIFWEISSEFGYNSQIGRTLEKTSTATVFIESQLFESVFDKFKDNWLNKNSLDFISKEDFLKFLNGFIYRLRIRGGIDHVFLKLFRTGKSNYFLITKKTNPQHVLIRNFGKFTRLPKLVTSDETSWDIFDRTFAKQNASNWYHQYFKKAFPFSDGNFNLVNEFYHNLIEYLVSEEILDLKIGAGVKNFAINPEIITINNRTAVYKCEKCKHEVYLSEQAMYVTNDMPCLQYNCFGKYKNSIDGKSNYYRTIYNRGKAIRIFASEHTGLLDRQVREQIESSFKKRPKHNSNNLLVSTSTLEMGIDIGDLNTAINTSMPPLPSNYLQRIGRAGRASGNAMILNFNSNDAHDLYFYSLPEEMMEGNINTPGCFIEAYDILRRHFIAFCFDSWTTDNPSENHIPYLLRLTGIFSSPHNSEKIFLNKVIAFIRKNSKKLFTNFSTKYQSISFGEYSIKIDSEPLENLHKELELELYRKIEDVFKNLKERIIQLLAQKNDLILRRDQLPQTDPERAEIENELKNVNNYYYNLQKTPTLEYLTNNGILPNYAFPETGVTLNAFIRTKTGSTEGSSYENLNIQVVRPASMAIRELAPDNKFYTQGYKLEITGAQVVNWTNELQEFRFCSNCDNIDYNYENILNEGKCPKCNDNSWGSSSNTHKFLKMSTMLTYTNSEEATLDDREEEREKEISSISFHLDFKESKTKGAWILKDIPFGIEYLKGVKIREINSGRVDSFDRARTIRMKNEEISDIGYVICKHCYKVHIPNKYLPQDKIEKKIHYPFCKFKETRYNGNADANFEELYFFREITTEAFKILLPVQHVDSVIKVQLFKSGIMLGLKKYYKGDPQHIQITDYKEYDKNSGRDNHFLILYDTIPGGTGYLGKLFENPQIIEKNRIKNDNYPFAEVLRLAFEEIQNCICQLEQRDGCYRCIYTYSNQYSREKLSRAEAEKVFENIYNSINEWKYDENGLSDSSNVEKIEESELEEWFITLLENLNYQKLNFIEEATLNKITRDNIIEYELILKNKDITLFYDIIPQFELDNTYGVENATVADFLIRCKDYKKNNVTQDSILETLPQYAIYLDGYSYHATSKNNRFHNDFLKRKSVNRTNKFISWTLTWDDLKLHEESKTDELFSRNLTRFESFINSFQILKDRKPFLLLQNNFARLIFCLMNPKIKELKVGISLLNLTYQTAPYGKCIKEENINNFINSNFQATDLIFSKSTTDWVVIDNYKVTDNIKAYGFQYPKNLKFNGKLKISNIDSSWEIESWKIFWRYFNLYQLFEEFDFEIEDKSVTTIPKLAPVDIFDTIKDNFDDMYHDLIKLLIVNHINFNKDTTFTLEDENSNILAEADLCLLDSKIVFNPFSNTCRKCFEEYGYTIAEINNYSFENIKEKL